ncbi:MAG: lipopolysaccharide biosynthesis protein [Nibricoccus sp.]
MLIGQTAINFAASLLSALLGLASVFAFTRLFSPHEYGVYLLGFGFATVFSTVFIGWFRNLILRERARHDGADVRGLVLSGYALACLSAPIAYGVGRLVGLDSLAALAAVGLAATIGLYELTQDLVRARLMATTAMKGAVARAVLVLALGAGLSILGRTGVVLLIAAVLSYVVATLIQTPPAWSGTILSFNGNELRQAARTGLPLTISLVLLAVSSVTDRFMIANLVGEADAGKYVAGLDLVRQTLMIPAISIAATAFPLAVRINAAQGQVATRAHLTESLDLLFAIILPAALGFAMISPHIANVLLGTEFRALATQIIPIIAIAVIFQVMTQQYLHVSFLLADRNSFYLLNTATIITVNVMLCVVLIRLDGVIGAAWARLGADIFGFLCAAVLTRYAFRVPFPIGRLSLTLAAALTMTLVVTGLDRILTVNDLTACVVLTAAGVVVYAMLCWAFDIAQLRSRLNAGLRQARARLASKSMN